MRKLSDPRETIEIVSKHDFDFRKRLGQNFLIDEGVIRRSIEAARVGKDDVVFEIGPGIGTLTQYLSEAAFEVVAIEIDKKLIPILGETLAGCENVEVLHSDVLKVDLPLLARQHHAGWIDEEDGSDGQQQDCVHEQDRVREHECVREQDGVREQDRVREQDGVREQNCGKDDNDDSGACLHSLKIVANLPYYITTPILMNLFRQKVPAQSITVMVQKEVADRMTAPAGSKDYGSLSIAVQYYAKPRIVEEVPPTSFVPHPKVTSAVVTMDLYRQLPLQPVDEELFFAITRAAFEQRRKTLVNALGSSTQVPYGKEQIAQALDRMEVSRTIRGEKLSIEEFVKLSDELSKTD